MSQSRQGQTKGAGRSITTLLQRVNEGRNEDFSRLVDMVYSDLRRVAAKRMRRGFDCPLDSLTEGPTALVHDVIPGAAPGSTRQWKNGDHFFAIATLLLNHVIGDCRSAGGAGTWARRAIPGKHRSIVPNKFGRAQRGPVRADSGRHRGHTRHCMNTIRAAERW